MSPWVSAGYAAWISLASAGAWTGDVQRPIGPEPGTATPGPTVLSQASTTVVTAAIGPDDCAASIPLRLRVAQLVWPAVYGDGLTDAAPRFAELAVGGAIVMTFPESATDDDLLALKNAGTLPLLLATDEEGGDVQRFRRLGAFPAAADVATSMTPAAAEAMIAAHAERMAVAGIDVVFAPVVDVAMLGGGGPLGDRTFSDDPAVVTGYAAAYIAGWQSAGIVPVLKHFPGHGSASGDTHDTFATTPPLAQLRASDLLPYAALAPTGAGVMVAHVQVPGLDEEMPASLSSVAIDSLLRGEYGYADALVFTDALGMDAITERYSIPDAAGLAIAAGADVVIFTNTDETADVIAGIVGAVESGRIGEQRVNDAVSRVLAAKGLTMCGMAGLVT